MRRRLTKRQYKIRKMIRHFFHVSIMMIITFTVLILAVYAVNRWNKYNGNPINRYSEEEFVLDGVELDNGVVIEAQLLTPNEYSRPQTKIKRIQGIVIHYVGNPNTTAQNNRDYFEGLATKHTTYASSQFVVGLEGEIIQCVPLNEVAYCSNQRNNDTISIEVCHPKENGKFNKATYESVVALTAYLCKMFDLTTDDVIRHYDVTGKNCPLYYVKHEDAWIQLKSDVKEAMKEIMADEKPS